MCEEKTLNNYKELLRKAADMAFPIGSDWKDQYGKIWRRLAWERDTIDCSGRDDYPHILFMDISSPQDAHLERYIKRYTPGSSSMFKLEHYVPPKFTLDDVEKGTKWVLNTTGPGRDHYTPPYVTVFTTAFDEWYPVTYIIVEETGKQNGILYKIPLFEFLEDYNMKGTK